jgi:uncharacterized protein YhaN
MKFDALKLLAYGPFSNKTLDFSAKKFGLHVVCGANEAGKSTALRALVGLLYGFGHKTEDAWLHDNKDLAVGAALVLADGKHLDLTRHKRRKNDLIDDASGVPFAQADLDKLLGRVGREAFEHTFGISHDALRLGVDSVLAAGGDLGQALFAATSGLNTLRQVMAKLEEQQNRLFAPRAKKAQINAAISETHTLRKKQRDVSASHLQWKKMKKQLDALELLERQTIDQLEALATQISLLTRHRDALKHVAQQKQLEKELDQIGPVPDLYADFSHERVETQMALRQATQAQKNIVLDLEEIDKKHKALVCDDQIIADEKLIENLAGEASVHVKAKTDSRTHRARVHQHHEAAQKALLLLRSNLTIESVQGLRLSMPDQARIQRLGAHGVKLKEARHSADRALRSAVSGMHKIEKELESLQKPPATEALVAALNLAGEHGKLETRLVEAQSETVLLQKQAEADLAALGLWRGSLGELERLALPGDETMRIFETDLAVLNRKAEDAEAANDGAFKRLKEKEAELAEMTTAKELPLPAELESRRRLRDKGWGSVREVWLSSGQIDAEFMAAFGPDDTLAEAYEKSVVQADETADILHKEARAVAMAEALRREMEGLKKELGALGLYIKSIASQKADLLRRWDGLWEPLGIVPLGPREMMAWTANVGRLKSGAAALRKSESVADNLRQDIQRVGSEIGTALLGLGIDVPENMGYSRLVDLARDKMYTINELKQARREIETRVATLKAEIETHNKRKAEVEQEYGVWSDQWDRAVAKLGFDAEALPEDVQAFVLSLEEVFSQLDKAGDLKGRMAGIESNYQKYTQSVNAALENLAPEMKNFDPEAAALKLNGRLKKEIAIQKERQMLEAERRKKQADLSAVTETLAALNEKMRLLCSEAKTKDPEQLPDIEKRAAARIKTLEALEKTNERLAELALGQDVEGFAAQVKSHDPDELNGRLDRLASEKKRLEAESKKLVADVALAKNDLESIGGESAALAIAEKAEGLVGKIEADVAHYVKLKLAAAILAKAIERYRQSNQSPVLEAASKYFKTITKEAFMGLRANYNDKGDPVINAVRPTGELLVVEQLSDGSRDQLFLALRLGGLSKYVKNNGPMPFIVDDVLVHFDDDRSQAALEAMALLSKETQIIFFTHHQHLVDLAQKSLPADLLQVHPL